MPGGYGKWQSSYRDVCHMKWPFQPDLGVQRHILGMPLRNGGRGSRTEITEDWPGVAVQNGTDVSLVTSRNWGVLQNNW